MLAHINPQEAVLLKRMGGSGTINPHTGLPEFMMADENYNYMQADGGGGGGDFDWYDSGTSDNFGNEGISQGGGAAITGTNPETGAVQIDMTGMAPGSIDTTNPSSIDLGPTPTYPPAIDLPPESTYTVPDLGPYTPLDVTPGELPDWYKDTNTTADNYTPVDTSPVYTGPEITAPDYTPTLIDTTPIDTTLPDLTPYTPQDTTPDLTPVTPDLTTPEPEVPTMTITDTRPDTTPALIPCCSGGISLVVVCSTVPSP